MRIYWVLIKTWCMAQSQMPSPASSTKLHLQKINYAPATIQLMLHIAFRSDTYKKHLPHTPPLIISIPRSLWPSLPCCRRLLIRAHVYQSRRVGILLSWHAGSAPRENLCQGNRNRVSIDQERGAEISSFLPWRVHTSQRPHGHQRGGRGGGWVKVSLIEVNIAGLGC